MCIIISLLTLILTHSAFTEQQQNILVSSQYHFIPNSSFFQFTLSAAAWQQDRDAFSGIVRTLQLQFSPPASPDIRFNFLVFPNTSNVDNFFQVYKCYVRAANEGFSNQNCGFTKNNTDCDTCIQSALFSSVPVACVNCTNNVTVTMSYSYKQDKKVVNSATLFIIDNTDVISKTGVYLQTVLNYSVSMEIASDIREITILFGIVILVFTLIFIISSLCLKNRSKKIIKKTQEFKKAH